MTHPLVYTNFHAKTVTFHTFERRESLKQHESKCRNHSNSSAVVNHHELGHSIDFANSCVIYPESHSS